VEPITVVVPGRLHPPLFTGGWLAETAPLAVPGESLVPLSIALLGLQRSRGGLRPSGTTLLVPPPGRASCGRCTATPGGSGQATSV